MILVLTSWPSFGTSGPQIPGLDKVAHFGLYAVLGYLVARALAVPRTRVALFAALAGITVFGLLDEVHQAWIPGREASVGDWIADVLGAATGIITAAHLLSLAPSRQDLPT